MRKLLSILITMAVALGVISVPTTGATTADKPVVYLTFDDGPNANTRSYLALLGQYNITATFFVTGRSVSAHPDILRETAAAGHAIANHTWGHKQLGPASAATVRNQLAQTNDLVRDTIGVTMTCYRPPYGSTNNRVVQAAADVGLTNANWTASFKGRATTPHAGGWDVDTSDYRGRRAHITHQLNQIQGGDVVLMHDIHNYSLAPLRSWLAANAHKFRFEPLPGCGGRLTEPVMDVSTPELWYRFQVGRLYSAYFERYPDAKGWEYWNTQYVQGVDILRMSGYFTDSAEFQALYGDEISDAEFVELVYNNVLRRPSDPSGKSYWLEQIAQGMSQGELMVFFAQSTEFVIQSGPMVTGECWTGDVQASYSCAAATAPGFTSS